MNDFLIHARGLTRIYRLGAAEVTGVMDISLEIPSGELVVLKGESGSGKSTLLALLGGLDHPGHLLGRKRVRFRPIRTEAC